MSSIFSTPSFFFFFNDTATTEIYTLSLHDALPISTHTTAELPSGEVRSAAAGRATADQSLVCKECKHGPAHRVRPRPGHRAQQPSRGSSLPHVERDRKSTRLNSSHGYISYAVFCLKKKKKHQH